MIFDNNTHYNIISSTIPAAEGYDCSYGFGKMMVEGAINEYSMFEAMLAHDYQECFAMKNGYTNEAGKDDDKSGNKASSGIVNKIVEILKKFIAKLKGIFDSFNVKVLAIMGNDTKLIEKYSGKLTANADKVNKVKVKWYPVKIHNFYNSKPKTTPAAFRDQGDIEATEDILVEKVLPDFAKSESISQVPETIDKNLFDDEQELEIGNKEIGGVSNLVNFVKEHEKNLNTIKANYSEAEELINNAIKGLNTEKTHQEKLHNVYTAWLRALEVFYGALNKAFTKDYKQHRAAFAKAASSLNKNVKEESTLLDAIAEAAEDEVDEVINTAINTNDSEEIANLTAASLNVLDSDVSKDPNELVYDKVDNYTDNADMDDHEGEIDVTINSREEEANLFSEMFY